MDMSAMNHSPRDLRASDAERDGAISELSKHFQAGRLTMEEFSERSDRALQARTGRDLANLLTDLPGGPAPMPGMVASSDSGHRRRIGPRRASPRGMNRRAPAGRIAIAAPIVAAIIAVLAASHHGFQFLAALAPALAVVVVFWCLVRGRRRSQ